MHMGHNWPLEGLDANFQSICDVQALG